MIQLAKLMKSFSYKSLFFQAIFDRNRKDELPSLQLEWIDGICSPLYEVMTLSNAATTDTYLQMKLITYAVLI